MRFSRSCSFLLPFAAMAVLAACNQRQPETEAPAPVPAAALPDKTAADSLFVARPGGNPWDDAQRRGISFRATGNEPGWYLEIAKNREVLLVTDTGTNRHRFPAVDILREDGQTSYIGSGPSGALRVVVRPGPCTDTTSGDVLESSVTVTLGDTELQGCGKALPQEP
jgi:uncharacterized membrane protein